jgi:hypothetical protein
MKSIGTIFSILIFTVPLVLGQTPNSSSQVSDSPSEGSSEKPPTQTQAGTADEENRGTQQEAQTQPEKKRRILKIVNDYELAADEALTTLIMIAGDAKIQGNVTGNVLVLGGDVELTQGSQVNGTLQVIGGQVSGWIEEIADLRISNDWKIVPAAVKLVMHPYIFWKIPDKQTNFRLTVAKSGLSVLMYLLIFALFPKPIDAIGGILSRRPIGSILFGILMLVVIPLTLALLTLSIVGVPFMLLGLALLFPLAVCGKTAIFLTLGSTIFSGRLKPLGVIFGYILYFMATALPYIDWVTFLLVNTISIGLCLLSGISTMLLEDRRKNISWSERV